MRLRFNFIYIVGITLSGVKQIFCNSQILFHKIFRTIYIGWSRPISLILESSLPLTEAP